MGTAGQGQGGSGREPGAEGPERGYSGARGRPQPARCSPSPHLAPGRPRPAMAGGVAVGTGRVTGTAAGPARIPPPNGREATFELVKQAVCFRCRVK